MGKNILDLLSPERQQEIVAEVGRTYVQQLRDECDSLAEFVRKLQKDENWNQFKFMKPSDVFALTDQSNGSDHSNGDGKGNSDGDSNGNGHAATKKNLTPKAGAGVVLRDQMVALLKKTPGMRSEQISKALAASPVRIKSELAKMREKGEVKTKGIKRATSYTLAS